MKLITKQSLVIPSIQSFCSNYEACKNKSSPFYTAERFRRITSWVPSKNAVEELNDILGTTAWTDLFCDECGDSACMLVQIGGEEINGVNVCKPCLYKAIGTLT